MSVFIFTAHSDGIASIASHGKTEKEPWPWEPKNLAAIWSISAKKDWDIVKGDKNRVHREQGEAGILFFISSLLFPGSVLEFREAESNSTNQALWKARAQEKQSYVSLKRANISFLTV